MSRLSGDFAASINEFESYPENLRDRATYPGALKAHKARLDIIEKNLFTQEARDIVVPFRDLIEPGQSMLTSLAPDL